MGTKKRNSFYIQGSILAMASIISRFIGILFRVPIKGILGNVGYGAYCNAYEIYNMALLLSTFSVPLAVSRLVSAREKKKEYVNSFNVLRVSFCFSAIAGLLMSLAVFFFADELAWIIKSPSCAIALRTLAPTILVFSIMGVIRGFFQGKSTMIPTSVSQILEQIVHVGAGLYLAYVFMRRYEGDDLDFAYGAAGATLGTLAGAVVSLVFLGALYLMYRPTLMRRLERDRSGYVESNKVILLALFATVFPIILNQVLYSVTGNIDSVLLNNLLQEPEETRQILWGQYSGEFRLLVNIPLAIASAIGVAVIPNVVAAITDGHESEIHNKIYQAVKFNMLIAIPCAFGLIALGGPIIDIMFNDSSETAKKLMIIGSLSVIFFSYSTTTNSILQGMGKLKFPVIHAIIGIVVYLCVDIPLLLFTNMGVYSLAIGYMVFPFTVGLLNWFRIAKEANYRQEISRTFIYPTLFSILMASIANLLYAVLLDILGIKIICLAISIVVAMMIYFSLMIFTKTINLSEIREFPMGNKIAGLLIKLGMKED